MHQQQKQEPWGHRDSLNVFLTYLNAHATACTVFLRHSFGTEALGWPGLFALLLILAVAGFNRSQGMQVYLALWLAALACQRLYTFWLVRRGVVWHSQYQGWPWLAALFTRGNGKAAVFIIEPFLVFGAGGMLGSVGETVVGHFLMWGAAALLVREIVNHTIDRKRLTAMRDAQLESEMMGEAYRRR